MRRLLVIAIVVVAVVVAVAWLAGSAVGPRPTVGDEAAPVAAATVIEVAPPTTTAVTVPAPTTVVPADERQLALVDVIGGELAPKSVVATPAGLVFAQNMMYRHTVTVYDEAGRLVETISDEVDPAVFGVAGASGPVRGAPVEAASTSNGAKIYVSNYGTYGAGSGDEGDDSCELDDDVAESYVYRIDTDGLTIDQVIPVGAVPKYLAVTPDDSRVIVANWCSFDISIVDTDKGVETARVPIGRHPRGIAVDATSTTAYVAVMGETRIAVVDLDSLDVEYFEVGEGPRHLLIDPDGKYLYATLNREAAVVKIDLADLEVVERVETGIAPRTMDMSPGGEALYVVNYGSDTMTKVLTADMSIAQRVNTGRQPIGVTYHPITGDLWVSNYADATIQIFTEDG